MTSPLFETRMKKLLESELLRACGNGDKEAIAQLVDDKGVALDCIDEENEIGLQPLMIACKRGHFEIVQYLLWHNTDILDNCDSAGWSALHWSILNGHYLITKELIEFGADLDLQSFSDNIYPIHLSIFSNKPSICKLLLDNNCKIDILYNNTYNINELLEYIQFKLKLLNQSQINRFKNIIFNSKQYKQYNDKLNNNKFDNYFNNNNNNDTDIEIILDDDTINAYDINNDDDQFEQIKKKYFNDSDSDSGSDSDASTTDSSENDNSNNDIGDIMSLLPQIEIENDILDLGNDSIIEENSGSENENENENDEINFAQLQIETPSETLTETHLQKQIENKDQKDEQLEITETIKNENPEVISNGLISINLDLLIESISDKLNDKFLTKNDFELFNEKQLLFNNQFKEEQSKSLKEIIDLNKEINDINNNLNNIKTEFKTNMETIKIEMETMIDNKLTKYEEWLRLNIEDKIDKNMNDISIFKSKQTELKLKLNKIKTHQIKQPSIETLKVGKIIEKELKKKKKMYKNNKNISNSNFKKQKKQFKSSKKQKKQRQKHIKSQSLQSITPSLNQSFSSFDNNTLPQLETDSSNDDICDDSNSEISSDVNDEINIYQNIINIQQNIFNQKNMKKKKNKEKTLKLEKNRHSAPSILPSLNTIANDYKNNNGGIFATVEMPIVLDENNKMKPKNLRRKRSNSYSSESPNSPKKIHANGGGNLNDYKFVDYNNYTKSDGYWE